MTRRPSPYRALTVLFTALCIVLIGVVLLARHAFETKRVDGPAGAQIAKAGEVSGGGITLVSLKFDMPEDNDTYGSAPDAQIMNANCTACHSASMALNQPRLTAKDWQGEVKKMRETYKAVIADKDIPAIVGYLSHLSSRLPEDATHSPSKPSVADAAG